MSKETAKTAAISGLIFSGLFAVFFVAMIVAAERLQPHSPGQKDWSLVLGLAFGVPSLFFLGAAVFTFSVSAIRALRKGSRGSRQQSTPDQTFSFESQGSRVRHPAIITFAGIAILIASAKISPTVMFFVGIPAVLIACGVAGGSRLPSKVPLRDTMIYVGISVAIVLGVVVYALYGR